MQKSPRRVFALGFKQRHYLAAVALAAQGLQRASSRYHRPVPRDHLCTKEAVNMTRRLKCLLAVALFVFTAGCAQRQEAARSEVANKGEPTPEKEHELACKVMYILTFASRPEAVTLETKRFLVSTLNDLDKRSQKSGAAPGLEKLKNAFGGTIGATDAAEKGDAGHATLLAGLAGNEVLKACLDYQWAECHGLRAAGSVTPFNEFAQSRARLEKCGEGLLAKGR